jgi:hypothetical protein
MSFVEPGKLEVNAFLKELFKPALKLPYREGHTLKPACEHYKKELHPAHPMKNWECDENQKRKCIKKASEQLSLPNSRSQGIFSL